MSKAAEAFRTIGEVASELDVPKHVLRFWEGKFPHIRPMKRGGGRRYYRPEDLELLRGIRHLLHAEGYTIKGVQKILREHGIDEVKAAARAALAAKSQAGKKRTRKEDTDAPPQDKTYAAGRAVPAQAEAREAGVRPASAKSDVIASLVRELEACRQILALGAVHPGVSENLPQRSAQGRP